jgi:hypothetical protein
VKLYAGTTEQFRADAQMHRIAEKLRAEYTTQIGHRPSPNEVASWQNSPMALSMLVDQAEVNELGNPTDARLQDFAAARHWDARRAPWPQ